MIARDGSLAALIELGDTGFVGGFMVEDYQPADRTFRRVTVEADGVDGAYDVDASAARGRHTLTVLVDGASDAEVRSRRAALLTVVERPAWYLDLGTGFLLSCGVSDSSTSRAGLVSNPMLRIVLTIPVQPAPHVY